MVLSVFKNKRSKEAKQEAKKIYVKAAMLSDATRDERMFKLRAGIRSRGHIDKAFIEGAKKQRLIRSYASMLSLKVLTRQLHPPRVFSKQRKHLMARYIPISHQSFLKNYSPWETFIKPCRSMPLRLLS